MGLIETDVHLFGVESPGVLYLFGTDELGRDMFARVLHAGRISLSVGLLGVAFSFVLGLVFGGISGYYGGAFDLVIQRIVELVISIPKIPLWMALSAALPPNWPPLRVYFGITVILSIVIHKLIDIVSKGGNYLRNVGPTAEGIIPEPSVERLEAMGQWLEANGEAIYGTTPGPIQGVSWCRSTKKAGTVYLHVFD